MARSDNQRQVGQKTKLRPKEIAAMFGVGHDKVLGWIHSGELRAINVASKIGCTPKFVVDVSDLRAFEARREVKPAPGRTPRRHRSGEHARRFYQ